VLVQQEGADLSLHAADALGNGPQLGQRPAIVGCCLAACRAAEEANAQLGHMSRQALCMPDFLQHAGAAHNPFGGLNNPA